MNDTGLLTAKEAADIFKVAESTIYSWMKKSRKEENSELPRNLTLKIGGTVRIRKKVLENFITNG